MKKQQKYWIVAGALALLASAAPAGIASAQVERRGSFELRGIAMLPTFDIADAANLGWGGGVRVGYRVSPKVRLMADVDVAVHGTDVSGFKINTYHYMGKIGYDVVDNGKIVLTLNLGAGAVATCRRARLTSPSMRAQSSASGSHLRWSSSSVRRVTSRSPRRPTWERTTRGYGRSGLVSG